MPTEPKRIKLNPETPTTKNVNKIPLPSLNTCEYDIEMADDVFGKSQTKLEINNEDYTKNNSQGL